jgi:acyl-CoA thioester hydrolase
MLAEHTIQLRVRYDECDPMGLVHHSNYLRYFEIARTEMYRAGGGSYRDLEASGQFVVVVRVDCRYRTPARYDDQLSIRVAINKITEAKIIQGYEIRLGEQSIVEAEVTLAVIDAKGRPQRIPEHMREIDPCQAKPSI